jgi:hypothetical protein
MHMPVGRQPALRLGYTPYQSVAVPVEHSSQLGAVPLSKSQRDHRLLTAPTLSNASLPPSGGPAKVVQAFREHIQEAMEAGDFGTEQLLKTELVVHEEMTHHLEHFLAKISLVEDFVK